MTERDELHLLSGAYALNALEQHEKAAFEVLLGESEELRTEVTGLSDTAVLLGLSSHPVTPSPELKANLMELLSSTPQLGPETQLDVGSQRRPEIQGRPVASIAEQRAIDGIASGSHVASHRASARTSAKTSARWFSRPVGALLASAASAALLLGGVAIGSLQSDPLEQLASASDLQTAVTDVDGGGTATLIWSDDQGKSAVLLEDLPALSADQVYQLWYIDDAGATSAGVVNAAGDRLQVLDGDRDAGDAVGVTVEPSGGSEVPSADPIVVIGQA